MVNFLLVCTESQMINPIPVRWVWFWYLPAIFPFLQYGFSSDSEQRDRNRVNDSYSTFEAMPLFVVFEADEEVDINANLFVSLESSNQHYHYLYATTTAPTTYVDKYSTT